MSKETWGDRFARRTKFPKVNASHLVELSSAALEDQSPEIAAVPGKA